MKEDEDIRKVLARNIKKHREILGLSQEKLAENAGISGGMVKDIEAGRTWVSDKMLMKLAGALGIDIYRLFVPSTTHEEEMYKTITNDILEVLKKIGKDVNTDIEKALKLWDLEKR